VERIVRRTFNLIESMEVDRKAGGYALDCMIESAITQIEMISIQEDRGESFGSHISGWEEDFEPVFTPNSFHRWPPQWTPILLNI